HWGVENGLHWVLDMAFDDDRNRTEAGDAPENLATLRRWVLSLLRQDKSRKGGIECKRMQMGWNEGRLCEMQILRRGVLVTCDKCAVPTWHVLSNITERMTCPGCGSVVLLPIEYPTGSGNELQWQ